MREGYYNIYVDKDGKTGRGMPLPWPTRQKAVDAANRAATKATGKKLNSRVKVIPKT